MSASGQNEPSVIRLERSEKVSFGPDSFYQPILNGAAGKFPIFTGIQTAEPGYETPPHSHPYVEVLHILDGAAEAWMIGHEDDKVRLAAGDTIALPPDLPHAFRVAGDATLRLLGTHVSPQRIVHFTDGETQIFD